jgi:hypothetical protein
VFGGRFFEAALELNVDGFSAAYNGSARLKLR